MNNRTLRIFILTGTLAILAIIGIQLYLLHEAFNDQQNKFSHSVQIALLEVIQKMYKQDAENLKNYSPVKQVSNNYFIVDVNDHIDANLLEFYLITELNDLGITEDFEYAIYNCETDQMLYGSYVHMSDSKHARHPTTSLPTYPNLVYYFGVHFPGQINYVLRSLRIWIFLASVTMIILFIFAYAIVTILQQKRLSELQRDFVNNMTHEFKTPITATRLALDSLLTAPEIQAHSKLQTFLLIIQQQNSRLNQQVERILQLAVSDKKQLPLHKESIDLISVLKQTTASFPKDQDRIHLHSDRNTPLKITADTLHLSCMLFNLIDNALKYSTNQVEITAGLEGRLLRLKVKDSGIGMEIRELKKIFNKFYRIPTGAVHNVKGFGLGLYYVHQVCRWHGWRVKVESTPGKGTEFCVEIPASQPAWNSTATITWFLLRRHCKILTNDGGS